MLGVIYTRVSSPRQVETGSLAQQELDCLRRCEEKGIDVVAVFKDDGAGMSEGPQENKPQLQAAVELCRRHKAIEALVVVRDDRIARTRKERLSLQRVLQKSGTTVHSVRRSIDATPVAETAS